MTLSGSGGLLKASVSICEICGFLSGAWDKRVYAAEAGAGDSKGSRTLNWVPFGPVVKSIFP